jgi:hypothetical protein
MKKSRDAIVRHEKPEDMLNALHRTGIDANPGLFENVAGDREYIWLIVLK